MPTLQSLIDDPVECLVPPPRAMWRALCLTALGAAFLTSLPFLPRSGVVVPHLSSPNSGVSYSIAADAPSFRFPLQNKGWFPLELQAVDGRAKGLTGLSTVVFDSTETPGRPMRRLRLPAQLNPGQTITVSLSFAHVDCAGIDARGFDVVVRASGPLGIPLNVGTVPWDFTRPFTGSRSFTGPDPLAIGWAAGITWQHCHPGERTPPG